MIFSIVTEDGMRKLEFTTEEAISRASRHPGSRMRGFPDRRKRAAVKWGNAISAEIHGTARAQKDRREVMEARRIEDAMRGA